MKDNYTISAGATVMDVLAKLNALSGRAMTLFVEDADGESSVH